MAGNTWLSTNFVAGQAVLARASISDGRARTVFYATNMMGEVVRRWETPSGSAPQPIARTWHRPQTGRYTV